MAGWFSIAMYAALILSEPTPPVPLAAAPQSYALVLLVKPDVSPALVQQVATRLPAMAQEQGALSVLSEGDVSNALGTNAPGAVYACHAHFPCYADIAARAHADAIIVARAVPSQNVADGAMFQMLVFAQHTGTLLRKSAFEVARVEDVDTALRASFLGIFGVPWQPPATLAHLDGQSLSLAELNDQAQSLSLALAGLPPLRRIGPRDGVIVQSLVGTLSSLKAHLQACIWQLDAQDTPEDKTAAFPAP